MLNVYKNIVMPVKLDGSQVDKAYISRIMKMLGIENKRKAFPGQLSGGQQQRVAIALTAILITVLCGMGIGTVLATIKEKQMNPGPGCNGAAIMGGVEVYEKVLEQPEVEWADLARLCTEGTPHNKEFAGLTVRLLGVSDSFYGHQYVDLISGEYPKVPEEILLSDTMAEHLGMEMKPGQKMTLNLIVLRGGERVEVTISGFYDNPLRAIEDYEEIYTAFDFPDRYNPEQGDENSSIYTKFPGVTAQTSNDEVKGKLEALKEKVGGLGVKYITKDNMTAFFAGIAALLVLIIVCGYFLIYNVFYISVVNDIRFMGNMKTIGMTGKQIRKMLGRQTIRLGIAGTFAGVIIGTGINLIAIQGMQKLELTFARFYEPHPALELGIVGAVLFTALTVWISSRKAFTLAAKISPVEASRFRSGGKKKMVFSVLSFALSGILFTVVYTMLFGYDTEWMVNRTNMTDFRVYQSHTDLPMEALYEVMDPAIGEALEELPFVNKIYTYHQAFNPDAESDYGYYPESVSRLRLDGRLREVLEQEHAQVGETIETSSHLYREGEDVDLGVLGIDAEALPLEAENLCVYDGELNAELFASGDYIIYQPHEAFFAGEEYQYEGMKAGEQIELSFYRYDTQEFATRSFTVMAVVGKEPDRYGREIKANASFIVPNGTFQEIYGDAANDMVSVYQIEAEAGDESVQKEQEEQIDQIIAEYFNTQVQLSSKYATRAQEQIQKDQKMLLGLFVSIIFGLIGLVNIVNTLVTDVLARKIEFASLQSIGMTGRQMWRMIFGNGMKMILFGMVVMIPVGLPIAVSASEPPMSSGFAPGCYAVSVLMVLLAGTLVAFGVAVVLTKQLNKKTIVERLRESE